jgi:hypothetical protein
MTASAEQLTAWALNTLHIAHLNLLIEREIAKGKLTRATELSIRANRRARTMFNEMIAAGASKPEGYEEREQSPDLE